MFWGNEAETAPDIHYGAGGGIIVVSYTAVEQDLTGIATATDIVDDFDPHFNDADGDDDIAGTLDDDFRPTCASSDLINAGDPGSSGTFPADQFDVNEHNGSVELTPDISMSDRLIARIDLGCYETHGNADSECAYAAADINQDECINIDDLLAVIGDWGYPGEADIHPDCIGSGVVDIDDLLMVVGAWGQCCPVSPGYSPMTVGDCWETCAIEHPNVLSEWVGCYSGCVDGLCKQALIDCD